MFYCCGRCYSYAQCYGKCYDNGIITLNLRWVQCCSLPVFIIFKVTFFVRYIWPWPTDLFDERLEVGGIWYSWGQSILSFWELGRFIHSKIYYSHINCPYITSLFICSLFQQHNIVTKNVWKGKFDVILSRCELFEEWRDDKAQWKQRHTLQQIICKK
jgi:hypothetical protein